ncbi:MAG: hypothetical protein CPDRYMAC_0268 [uncultured Paraburkholderia sp.]|nr:MAG: hypothetical protein CPDRYDRY_6559 [uncultured Paraburkholderia sp.]CAH2910705.1 MAG: hypothetical protein CPDRYMAC_0268 [uncultured Paraburkholderia sp.]
MTVSSCDRAATLNPVEYRSASSWKSLSSIFSGNVGKSTVVHHLLAPRLNDTEGISIGSINSDDREKEAALRGFQFDELQDQLMRLENAVVDVGVSNVEDFVRLMQSYGGSHEDFDMFIVPAVSSAKQQVDTIATLRALSDLGVPSSKIRFVMNMVDRRQDLGRSFAKLFEFHSRSDAFSMNRDAVIYENPIFEKIKGFDRSIIEIRDDPRELRRAQRRGDGERRIRGRKGTYSADGHAQTSCEPRYVGTGQCF